MFFALPPAWKHVSIDAKDAPEFGIRTFLPDA